MSDRTDFFTGQLVTQQDMDVSFDGIEQAIWDAASDMGFYGIITGFAVTESSPNALTVQVASGSAYSGEGKRLRVTDLDTTVDISVDRDANDTAPLTGGNKRYVSVILTPDRTLDDVRPDINQFPVYYRRYEATKIEVIMGAEAPSPVPLDVPIESILLCDILLDFGQTTVANGDIDFDRCTYMFSYEYASVVQQYATITEALQSIVDIINNNTPAWSTITTTYGGTATWANSAAWLPTPTTLDDAVETYIVSALGATTSTSGAHLLGVYQSAYQSPAVPTLASGPLFARLESMRDASNIYIAALPSWPDGDNTSNPADSVFDAVTKLMNNIAARASSTDQGIRRMGVHGTSFSLASWQALTTTTVYGVFAGLNSATGTDGAAYIGAKASGALLAGTVRSQLDALDTAKAALAGATFTGAVVLDGGATVPSGDTLTITGTLDVNGTITGDASNNVNVTGSVVATGDVGGARLRAVVLEETIAGSSKVLTAATGTYIFDASGIPLAQFRLGLPTVSSGNPILFIRGKLMPGSAKVYFCDAADVGGVPANYYEYWDGGVSTGPVTVTFQWAGGRWHVIGKSGSGLTGGAGTYAT